MLKVIAKSIAKEDKINEIIELSKELVKETRKEAGCISYELYQDINDPSIFTMIEEWEDEEAFNNHGNTEHMKRIVPKLNELRKEKATVNVYKKII